MLSEESTRNGTDVSLARRSLGSRCFSRRCGTAPDAEPRAPHLLCGAEDSMGRTARGVAPMWSLAAGTGGATMAAMQLIEPSHLGRPARAPFVMGTIVG